MESNGALHWEMMKKVEQKARSLHEFSLLPWGKQQTKFQSIFFVYCPPMHYGSTRSGNIRENWYNSLCF
jgi:hypothetical protein